jgi:hypothetical protein
MQRPEQTIHKAVADHLRQRGVAGLVWWHTNNNVARRGRQAAIQGAIAKGLGVRAGVSDIIAVHDGRIFALELKAPGGRPTEAQLEFIADMNRAGAFTCVAEGVDAAIRTIEAWGLVRGAAEVRGAERPFVAAGQRL